MRVRVATNEDAAAIVEAFQWLFDPPGSVPQGWEPERALAATERFIAADGSEIFLADDGDGAIAGFCTVALDLDSIRFGRRAWVEDLAVDSRQRSRGIGKALLDAAKEWALARDASHLELDSADTRADAHRFYRREAPSWESRSFGWVL